MAEVQKDKIVVVGTEEFTLGFELIGISSKGIEELESLFSKDSGVGIVIMQDRDYNSLSLRVQNRIEQLLKPIVIVLSEEEIKTNSIRDLIIRSLGVDLMKEKK